MKYTNFLIKLYDINWFYLGTVASNKLKRWVRFTNQINWWLWNLDLTFDLSFSTNIDEVREVRLYYFDENNSKWKLLYRGIRFQDIVYKEDYEEYTLTFVWLWSILYNKIFYDFDTINNAILYENTLNQDPVYIIYKLVENTKMQECTIDNINWTFDNWEQITWSQWWIWTLKILDTSNNLAVVKLDIFFNDWETITWSSSGATWTIHITAQNRYYKFLSMTSLNEYWQNFNKQYNYKLDWNILEDIWHYSAWYYYYIDVNWVVYYNKLDNTPTYNLYFGKNIFKINNTIRYNDIENKWFFKYYNWIAKLQDNESINKYGAKEFYMKDTDILDEATATNFLQNKIDNNKNPKKEIVIRTQITAEILNKLLLWRDTTNNWNTYTQNWRQMEWNTISLLDLKPWDKINILNINHKMRWLIINKIIFNNNYLEIYLNDYKNLYSLL